MKKHFLAKKTRKKEEGTGVAKKDKKVEQEGAEVEKGRGRSKASLSELWMKIRCIVAVLSKL